MFVTAEDVRAFTQKMGMPQDMVKELAVLAKEQLPKQFGDLANAVEQGDWLEMHRQAHRYKGAVATFTDGEIWKLAREIEGLCKVAQDMALVQDCFDALSKQHARFIHVVAGLAQV